MKAFLKRIFLYIPLITAALLQNVVHESTHYAAARLLGEEVLAFKLFTNGWGTSQVIFAAPIEQRTAGYWLLIAWLPAVLTVTIGLLLYTFRDKLITKSPTINIFIWYIGVMFMVIDPIYFGVLSWFFEGSDVNAAELFGWPTWPVQILGLLMAVVGIVLTIRWRKETQTHLEDYQMKIFAAESA